MEGRFIKQQDTIEQLKAEIFCLKGVIENLPGSIYWKDKNGMYLGRNTYSMENMERFHVKQHGAKDAIIGKTDYDFFSKEIADLYRKNDLEVMQAKKSLSLEEPVTLPNGEVIVQLSTKRPFYSDKGEVIGIIGNTVDITYLKLIESELRHAKETAEQANLIKTEFIRNMEHDIRTPFSGIFSMASHLWENELDEIKKEYLGDITQCAKELLAYCNGILDFSKIESGMITLIDKKFNLDELVRSIIQVELPAIKIKHLTLKTHYDSSIPHALVGDRYRVCRILINLIGNAIKFTRNGYIKLEVLLIKKIENSVLIRFIIEDTGIGVPSDKQEYIFEKFSRLSFANQGLYKGIGLGLKIVKQFVHDLGGEIDLMSEVDKGTKFICTLPFKLPLTNDFIE